MLTLVTAIGSIASQWLSNKAEKSKAIQAKELEMIQQGGDWEALHAQGSQSSWKDEWFTVWDLVVKSTVKTRLVRISVDLAQN